MRPRSAVQHTSAGEKAAAVGIQPSANEERTENVWFLEDSKAFLEPQNKHEIRDALP